MRLRHREGRTVHLSHGYDVRPARDLNDVITQLDTYATAVRARLGVDVLGVGLWLPPTLAAALAVDSRARARLHAELDARGLEVVTLSGLPYGEDPQTSAKTARYEPDWATADRLEYTLDLARILVDLLPDDALRGSVSTLGIGRREGWGPPQEKACTRILGRLSRGLAEIAWQTGRAVRVGFQPEPGAVMDTVDHTVAALTRVDADRVGVCLDLADLACTWQDPAAAITRLTDAGVSVVKVRISAAIEAADPAAAVDVLRGYVEPHHLHQVTTGTGGYADDLGDALRDMPPGPWRIRYHVPLHTRPAAPLTATTDVWRAALRHLMAGDVPVCEHLDVGTETWDVLPPGERPGSAAALAEGVAAEVAYAKKELMAVGLVPTGQPCAAR